MRGKAAGRFCRELADCLSAIGSVKLLRLSQFADKLAGNLKACEKRWLPKSIRRNGFTLPWHEFQPVPGKIFQQRVIKILNSNPLFNR
jgi:hypothetical protein